MSGRDGEPEQRRLEGLKRRQQQRAVAQAWMPASEDIGRARQRFERQQAGAAGQLPDAEKEHRHDRSEQETAHQPCPPPVDAAPAGP